MEMPKIVVYEDSRFRLVIEFLEGAAMFHCLVYKYGPKTYKDIVYYYSLARDWLYHCGCDNILTYTTNPKFCLLVDSTLISLGKFMFENKEYEVLKWKARQSMQPMQP